MRKALVLLLLLLTFSVNDDVYAQMVPDSIQMELHLYSYQYRSGPSDAYYNCGSGIYATWPDLAGKHLNRKTSYSDYRRVATEGMYIPRGSLELVNGEFTETIGISVPDSSYAHWPSLGTGSQGGGKYSDSCGYYREVSARSLTGVHGGLNAAPFWIPLAKNGGHGWYAVYDVNQGTPIADFKWDQPRGTDIAFDARFPISREVEVPAIPVVTYAWDFGDQSTGSGAAPTHTYAEPGTYTVKLTVTDDDGQEDDRRLVVKVRGVVIEHRIVAASEAFVTDTLIVTASIKNVGTVKAASVSASKTLLISPEYPEEGGTGYGDATRDERFPGVEIFTDVEPGELRTFKQEYIITAAARAYFEAVLRATSVEWTTTMIGVRGEDENGLPAKVIDLCEDGPCSNKTLIKLKPLEVDYKPTTFRGEVAEVNAGLVRAITPLFSGGIFKQLVPIGFPPVATCNSGCVDLNFEITDGSGDPVPDAIVELTMELIAANTPLDKAIVTPAQGGGFFCNFTTCGAKLKLEPADSDGKAFGRFWFPGLKAPIRAKITAKATKGGHEVAEHIEEITLLPAEVEFGQKTSTLDEIEMSGLAAARGLTSFTEFVDVGAWCKWIQEESLTNSKALAIPIDGNFRKALKAGVDYVCGDLISAVFDPVVRADPKRLDPSKKLALLDAFNKLMDVAVVYWFQMEYEMSVVGTGKLRFTISPPFLDMDSDFTDTIKESVRAMAKQYSETGSLPSTQLNLYEASYTANGTIPTPHLYFQFKTTPDLAPRVDVGKLITNGYDPRLFLTQKTKLADLNSSVSANDQSISLVATGKNSLAPDSTFDVGHVVVLDAGLETEETVQIVSISESTLSLSVPLKFNHAAGASVAYLDSLEVGLPESPLSSSVSAMPGASTTPSLDWYSRAPAMGFNVEVATDTLFTNILQTYTDLDEASVTLEELSDRSKYYWRVAATNLSGTGKWSTRYSFFTGRPIGDDLSEAIEIANELDSEQATWHYATTAEINEASASCGNSDNSTWFLYTAPATQRVALETFDSGFDTELSVWTGASHPLAEVVCNDEHANPGGDLVAQSYVEFEATGGTTYFIRITGADNAQGTLFLKLRTPTTVTIENDDPAATVTDFALSAYPNPTNNVATVMIENPDRTAVQVGVYDLLGRQVAVLANDVYNAGVHEFEWDTRSVPTGVYFVIARGDAGQATQSVTVMR